jgi:predicted Zn-dependent peptidase
MNSFNFKFQISNFRFLSGLLLFALLVNPAWAQSKAAEKPNGAGPAEASAGNVVEFEVNGLKVLFKRRTNTQTVATGLFIRGGARNLTTANAGIEDLTLETATEGSLSFPRERLRAELARTGASIGAGADYDYSVLSLVTTSQSFARSWDVFADVVMRPAFAPQDFALVKERTLAALKDDTDTPDSFLARLDEQSAYAGHPYLNRPDGTEETVARLAIADLRAHHRKIMETSRLLLVVVGDVDSALLRSKIETTLGKLPRGAYVANPAPPLDFKEPSVEVTARELPTNYVQGTFAAPAPDSPDIYPMRVARSILNDRVFEEVRVKRNLSYAPSASLNNLAANTGGIYVTAVEANRAVGIMLDEIERLQNIPVNDYEIASTIAQSLTNYYLDQETNAAQARELARYELIGGGWRNSFELLSRLRAVTPADVRRVARKYMRNLRFVVIGNPRAIDRAVFTRKLGG